MGNEVSIPANPTPTSIKQYIKAMVATGKLCLGELCASYALTHVKVVDEEVVSTSLQLVVHG